MGPRSTKSQLTFFLPSLQYKICAPLTEFTRVTDSTENVGEISFIFWTNWGHESGDQVSTFGEENPEIINAMKVYLYVRAKELI